MAVIAVAMTLRWPRVRRAHLAAGVARSAGSHLLVMLDVAFGAARDRLSRRQ